MSESPLYFHEKRLNSQEDLLNEAIQRQQNALLHKLLSNASKLKKTKLKKPNIDPIQSQMYVDWMDFKIPRKRRIKTQVDLNLSHKDLDRNIMPKKIQVDRYRLKNQYDELERRRQNYSHSVQLPKISKNFRKPIQLIRNDRNSQFSRFASAKNSNFTTIERQQNSKRGKKVINNESRLKELSSKRKEQEKSISQQIYKAKTKKIIRNQTKIKLKGLHKDKGKTINKQWMQINILKMETYFMKIKKKLRDGNHGQNIPVTQLKQFHFEDKWDFPTSKDKVADFIYKYKPVNQKIIIDNLVRSQHFSVILNEQGEQPSLYMGDFVNNQKTGIGILVTKNSKFEGQWLNNQKIEGNQITPQGYFVGRFKKNKRHGQGEFFWAKGQYYSGQWNSGQKNGSGMWKSGKGDSYIGHWSFGKVQGYGVHITHTGQRYEGQFKDFLKEGKGKQTFPNGDIYEGQYHKGKPNGKGKYIWKNGIIFVGNFIDGYRHGLATIEAKDYVIFKGQFEMDKINGKGELFYKNGNQFKGEFKNGQKQGFGIMNMRTSKRILEGRWKNNQLQIPELQEK